MHCTGATDETDFSRGSSTLPQADPIHSLSSPHGGGVFFWEGILKFVYTNQGVGRFTKLGIPFLTRPQSSSPALRLVAASAAYRPGNAAHRIPFVVEMIVAILTTKISLYLGTSPLPMPPALPKVGIWAVLHEIAPIMPRFLPRCSIDQWPGKWSLDAVLQRNAGLAKQTNPAPRSECPRRLRINAALQRRRVSTSSSSLPNRIHR